MDRLISLCGALALAAAATASGEDFPLTFRTIPAKDVMSFPGNAGTYAPLRLSRPAKLRREPRTLSGRTFYGECGDTRSGGGFLVRLDESGGEGLGYTQLIVDMNQNGDLTDDPVAPRAVLPTDRRTGSSEQILFGPIQAPVDKAIAGGRPIYYASVYLSAPISSSARTTRLIASGRLKLKTGWYLDTTVSLNGLKQKVGVCDSDTNLRLGDISRAQTATNRGQTSWHFQPGDDLLVDADGSGGFNPDLFQSETLPFGPILYLGGKAYQVTLAPDCKSLRVEPWAEPLAEVALQPHGNQVRTVTLGWEQPGGQWQLIRPAVTAGKLMVPPGDYRLYACSLVGQGAPRDQVMVSGMQRFVQTPVSIAAGKANLLDCGAPLEIKVTATKAGATSRSALGDNPGNRRPEPQTTLRINASLIGAGGEVYSTYFKGEGFRSRPPKPSFSIADAGGRTLASGNLEYG
jgi:hypothetical protein